MRLEVRLSFLLLLTIRTAAAATDSDNVVLKWDNAALQAIRDIKPAPPVVARDLAIVHTCIFDAWAAYDGTAVGTQLGDSLRRPLDERTDENKIKAVSFAALRALNDLFPQPAEQAQFVTLMNSLGFDSTDRSTDVTSPQGIGNVACDAVLNFRHHDGSNQLGDLNPGAYSDYTGYTPVNTPTVIVDPNRWQPLRIPNSQGDFTVQKFAMPQWSKVIPFALESSSEFRPTTRPPMFNTLHPEHLTRGSRAYIAQATELVRVSASLTDRQKMIAEYWADGPTTEFPPGHWCLISQFVSHRDNHSIDQDAKMFFALANALMDAGIAAWDVKREVDYVRPITAVHYVFRHKRIRAWGGPLRGTRMIRGEKWQPYQAPNVVTPPFPEYVSGHSTYSASAAEILRQFTGSDSYNDSVTFPAGVSKFETGKVPSLPITLNWRTFTEAADQAGISRIYGGIHFPLGNAEGKKMGASVGRTVWQKALTYFK